MYKPVSVITVLTLTAICISLYVMPYAMGNTIRILFVASTPKVLAKKLTHSSGSGNY